jgi:general stress protein 26
MITGTMRTLFSKPLIARMTTIDPDGYPHTVPVWFDIDQDDIIIISVRDTHKVGHVLDNPKGAVVVGGEPDDEAGYMFKGNFVIEEDPDRAWTHRLIDRYEDGAQAEKDKTEWADLDMIVMRLKVEKVLKVN